MTTKRMSEPDFDTLLTAWFESDARVHEPDALVDNASLARSIAPTPAGSSLNGGSDATFDASASRARLATLVLLIVLLVAAIVAIAVAGSARPLPDPFGPAAMAVSHTCRTARSMPRSGWLEPDPANDRCSSGGHAGLGRGTGPSSLSS
jgi:hypothetical protein